MANMELGRNPLKPKTQFSLKEHMHDQDAAPVCYLYMANYMLFFWIQLALSVVLITFYILLTLVMGHNECRYQKVDEDALHKVNP